MNFEIDDVMNDTIMGIPRKKLESILSEKDMKGENTMDYKTAYKKLREAKVEALANSTNIRVGRRELNKALDALEIAEEISKIYEKIEEMEKEADKGIAIEKIGEAWGYEKVLKLLKPLVEKRRD